MTRELTRSERSGIRRLVTGLCANFDRAYGCLPLDGSCYMMGLWWTGAYCRYFEAAVLPTDHALESALTDTAPGRCCALCGEPIRATGNRAKFCETCAEAARRKRQREYMRNRRGDVRF